MYEDESEIIVRLYQRMSTWHDRKKEITERRIRNIAEEKKKMLQWNYNVNETLRTNGQIKQTDTKDDNIFLVKEKLSQDFSILVNDFNQGYCNECALILKFEPNELNKIYKCASQILVRFNDIQSDGSSISRAIYNELSILHLLMNKVMIQFWKLVERCHDKLKDGESTCQRNKIEEERFNQSNNEIKSLKNRMVFKLPRKQNDEQMIKTSIEEINLNRHSKIIEEETRQKHHEKISNKNDCTIRMSEDDKYKTIRNTEDVEEVFKDIFSFDKTYCHNIRKMVNNICSQITSANPHHTVNKLHQILNFLQGKPIALVGSDNKVDIDLKHHRDALNFFWYLFYRAVLIQAETQFSVNVETAVTFASVTAALFGYFPDRLDGFFQLIYERYKIFDSRKGLLIDNDQFLASLKGVARLIAALFISIPPPRFQHCVMLSVARLWSLLAKMESDEIQESLSAEVIYGLLEIGGNSLLNNYKSQFIKMLMKFKEKFQFCSGISEISLVLMIDDACQKQQFEVQGYLDDKFWSTNI